MDKKPTIETEEGAVLGAPPEKERQKALLNILEDMQKDKELIENQRKAILNTLEDVKQTQEQLQKRYFELNILKDLLQELGFAMKIEDAFRRIIKALKQVLPESASVCYVVSPSIPGMNPKFLYVHGGAPLNKDYLDAVKWSIKMSFKGLPAPLRNREDLKNWIETDFRPEFVAGGIGPDPKALPLSLFNSSLAVGDDMIGFVNVSSSEESLFTQKDITLANTILGAGAGSILRLSYIIQSEEMRIRSLVDGLSNGVIVFNKEKRATMINPAARKITGLSAETFNFSDFSKLFKGVDFESKITETLKEGKPSRIDEVDLGRFVYEAVVTPVRDYRKNIVGGALVLHDITHLEEVNRMKTEFVSVVSHQLRTPLTAIKLFTEMLADEEIGELNAQQADYMGNVQESTERMIRLVNDLLNISRLETGRLKIELEPVQMEDFIFDIINEAAPLAKEKDCGIIFKKPAEKLEKIPIDPVLMRQVVHNLIMNAIQYSPVYILEDRDKRDGECDVVVALEKEKAGSTREKAPAGGKKWGEDTILISVKDKGLGIPEESRDRIFEKFFRAGNAYKLRPEGSGLGLYVVKMIVEASGGEIWFESEEGRGTIFYVRIPVKGMTPKKGVKGIAA